MISHSAKPVSCGVAHLIQGLAGRDKMRGGFCYNTDVHLKVKGPKKPSGGAIRKDADYLRATCVGATAMKTRIRLANGRVVAGAIQPAGVTARGYC